MARRLVLYCWSCGASLAPLPQPLGREARCLNCGQDLHVCKMCINYNKGRANQCSEAIDDVPSNKEKSNFCDWFSANEQAYVKADNSDQLAAKKRLYDLFGDEPQNNNAVKNPFED